jgi:hypothetical protein
VCYNKAANQISKSRKIQMSHFTAVKGAIPVSQKATLIKALEALGLSPEVGSRIEMASEYVKSGYDKTQNNYADIVIRGASIEAATGKKLHMPADIGFRDNGKGTYELIADDYSIGREMSENAMTLLVGGKPVGVGIRQLISYAYGAETAKSLGATVKLHGNAVVMQPANADVYGGDSLGNASRDIYATA